MRRFRRKKILLFLSFLIALGLVIFILFWINPGKNIINPIFSGTHWVGLKIDNFKNSIRSQSEVIKQNEELKQQVINLSIDSAKLNSCLLENENIKQQLNFLSNEDYEHVSGRVIGKLNEFAGAQTVYILNRGGDDGIETDCSVIISDDDGNRGILVGKIIKTDFARSYFILTHNYHSSVAGTLLNSSQESSCLIAGNRDNVMELSLLPVNRDVAKGDLVVTSGLEEKIREDFSLKSKFY